MTRLNVLRHEFVVTIPRELEEGILYVSMEFATAAHNCCCGCGNRVFTPFSPTDWRLTYDGRSVSLHPSIGNWSFACRSHYWIDAGRVRWAAQWSREDIDEGRARDRRRKARSEEQRQVAPASAEDAQAGPGTDVVSPDPPTLWSRLWRSLFG
jgi:hypothetical protein